jgi:hypothetical protein
MKGGFLQWRESAKNLGDMYLDSKSSLFYRCCGSLYAAPRIMLSRSSELLMVTLKRGFVHKRGEK